MEPGIIHSRTLKVEVIPKILTIQEGKNGSFHCEVKGTNDDYKISWKVKGKKRLLVEVRY